MAADWHDIPRGHYAIPVVDDDCRGLGYKLFERKVPRTYKTGKTVGRHGWHGWHGWRCTYLIAHGSQDEFIREIKDDNAYTRASDIAFVLDSIDYCRAVFGAVTGRCGCCGRTLTDPDSKMRGIGPSAPKEVEARCPPPRRFGGPGFPVLAVFKLGSRYEKATTAGACSYARRRACRAIIPT